MCLGLSATAGARVRRRSRVAALEAVAVPSGFNGVFAYARNGRIEALRAHGFADLEAGRPVKATTAFRWGSATKWLVSVAVLRMAEQGRLRLDAPITHYLPEFRRETGDRVTLLHLLSNRSGVPDLLSRQIGAEPELRTSSATAGEMVARFGAGDLAFVPGEGWDYAALNWVIVVAIMEKVSGTDFPSLLRSLPRDLR